MHALSRAGDCPCITFRTGFNALLLISVPRALDHSQNRICLRPEALWHGPNQSKEAAELRDAQSILLHGTAQPSGLPSEQVHGSAGNVWRMKGDLQ